MPKVRKAAESAIPNHAEPDVDRILPGYRVEMKSHETNIYSVTESETSRDMRDTPAGVTAAPSVEAEPLIVTTEEPQVQIGPTIIEFVPADAEIAPESKGTSPNPHRYDEGEMKGEKPQPPKPPPVNIR